MNQLHPQGIELITDIQTTIFIPQQFYSKYIYSEAKTRWISEQAQVQHDNTKPQVWWSANGAKPL